MLLKNIIVILKFILLILILVVLTFALTFYLTNKDKISFKDTAIEIAPLNKTINGVGYYQNENKDTNVVVFKYPIKFSYTSSSALELSDQSRLKGMISSINGSYFIGSSLSAKPAGLLSIYGDKYQNLVQDNQLTHVVAYNIKSNNLEFISTINFNLKKFGSEYLLFQTGPLLIENGKLRQDLINNSINGKGKYLRSVLGFTSAGDKFIAITRYNLTLSEFSNILNNLEIFKNVTVTAINLDGGSSTSMYSRDVPLFNFKEAKTLPLIIGF